MRRSEKIIMCKNGETDAYSVSDSPKIMLKVPENAQAAAFHEQTSCNNFGITDADDLSKEVSKAVIMSGSSRGMQDEVPANRDGCAIDTAESDILSSEVACAPRLLKKISQENQASKVDVSQNLCRVVSVEKKHVFWETQPVEQYQDRERNIEEGPIAPMHNVAHIRTEPYKLPKHYEWCTCDVNCKDTMTEIYSLLSNHYVEDVESMFRCDYSMEFLKWTLKPPGYLPNWHIGVRVQTTKRLVAFITGIPATVRVRDTRMLMAEINFLCVHKKLRSKRLAPLLIREITRRVHLENIWQAVYTAAVLLPTPIATCHYWHRALNPKKLIKVGFSQLNFGMTMSRVIKHYRLPYKTTTPGFRAMERGDLPGVVQLLRQYLLQFVISPELSDADVAHWLVPVENVVSTFVVEDAESHNITDLCSFYTIPSTILGNKKHNTLKAAHSFYNVATKTPLPQLVNDLMVVAKHKDHDVFTVLDIMHNQSFLKDLKFKLGDGQLQYYLYNYRLKDALVPGDLGIILL